MTPEIISTCVIALFLIVLLAGFLFGLARGFNKSLVRLLLVVAMLVVAFFITPLITDAVMKLDISNLGISVGGQTATSISDIIVNALNQIPAIADISGTEAFETIITVVPKMVINLVLFLVVFLILRLISMIIYWIISGICFSKKKTEGKNKHRLLGSVVGLVQNFIIFLVILVPVVGCINILGDIESITTNTTPAVEVAATSAADQPTEDNQVSPYQTVNDVIDAYDSSWVAKFLHSVKLDQACMYVFDELTTTQEGDTEYNLRAEANNVAVIYMDIKDLQEVGFDLSNTDTITVIQNLINHCYDSDLTAKLIDEVVPLAVAKWNNNETFCGIAKPSFAENESLSAYENVLQDLLNEVGSSQNVHATLISTTNMLKSVLGTAKDIVADDGSIDIDKIGDLLTELTQDESTMDLAKAVVQENLSTIIDSVMNIPSEDNAPAQDEEGYEEYQKGLVYKNMITETVNSILDADYADEESRTNEILVVTETLKVADKINNAEEITEQDAEAVIAALDNSTVILETLKEDNSAIKGTIQELMQTVDQTTADNISNAIAGLENDTNKEALYAIFGFNPPEVPAE